MRLEAFGDIAKYINDLECTDDEERYLDCEYYYDANPVLQYIIIPAKENSRPAKIITSGYIRRGKWPFRIFGQQEHINVADPVPMSVTDYHEWLNYKICNPDW